MEEYWKDIPEYEGLYQVSNLGRIKSLKNNKEKKEKILKPIFTKLGYAQIFLSNKGNKKHKYIHRLVAQTFIKNYDNSKVINHKDFNTKNNNVDNLECVTIYENNKYSYDAGRIKLPPPQKSKIIKCLEDERIFNSLKEASEFYNINISMICNQLKGRTRKTHNKT